MRKLSDEKMLELKEAIQQADDEMLMRQNAAIYAFEMRIQKILAFDYPEASRDLIAFFNEGYTLDCDDEKLLVDALLAQRLSEKDFLEAMRIYGCPLDRVQLLRILQAVCDGKISLALFFDLIQLGVYFFEAILEEIVQAVLDKKIPTSVFSVLLSRYSFYSVRPLIAKAYIEGLFSATDLRKMYAKGERFTAKEEQLIISSVIDGQNSDFILVPLFEKNNRLMASSQCMFINAVADGKIPLHLLWQQVDYHYPWANAALDTLYDAVEAKKIPEEILAYVVEDKAITIGEEVWKKFFQSGVDFLVRAYLQKFYPELVAKL